MVDLKDLRTVLDWELNVKKYNMNDRFNGLLVSGRKEIQKIGIAVNTTIDTIEEARAKRCDILIVHNGGWGETDCDMQEKKKRLLNRYRMSLYIAHASLDCHDSFGTSVAVAEKLGITPDGKFCNYFGGYAGRYGSLPVTVATLRKNLKQLNKDVKITGKLDIIKNIAVIAGYGAEKPQWLFEAARKRCTAVICGKTSSFGSIYAYERGIVLIILGETNLKIVGLIGLGNFIKERFPDLKIINLKEKSW